jgi:uncharacterized protein YyaL (SSP411 family)
MNRLLRERSPYLRHSANQKIDWYPWSEEAFEKARKEDKPIFLSSGATWCHWCHVMAKECFENEEIVQFLNDNFINIKLDRDERPDVDRRYQMAIAAMGFSGGWPLSVFLTPDRKPFFGGTYFPPEDALNRPGFKKILKTIVEFYKTKKKEIYSFSEKLIETYKQKSCIQGSIKESTIEQGVSEILSSFDFQNGGFGHAPKFPMSGAIEFLMKRYVITANEFIGYAVKKTLESMAKGGFYDQIGGGFHRYSTDESWIIPHFEKMAEDNAWLLRNYIDGFSLFRDEYFKEVAYGIISFLKNVLSDPEGGFYTSQDADVTPDDEGGYFTWKDEEIKRMLDKEEFDVLSLYLFHEKGKMQRDKSKRVLCVVHEIDEIARILNKDKEDIQRIISSGKEKLLRERNKRKAPFVDKSFYTSINGMLITSYLRAYRVLKNSYLKEFALKSLEKIIRNYFIDDNKFYHCEGVKALLDDYIYFIEALISSYEVTGERAYLVNSQKLMNLCIKKLWDDEGGFFDTEDDVVGLRLKGIEDIPHPSPNSLSIIILLKLFQITGETRYQEYAEKALRFFSSKAEDMKIHAGYFFSAIDSYFNMGRLFIEASPESELAEVAHSSLFPYSSIFYGEDKGRVSVCYKNVCYEPIERVDILKDFFKKHLAISNLI